MEKITRLSSLIKRARDARLEGAGEGEDKSKRATRLLSRHYYLNLWFSHTSENIVLYD